MHTSVLYYQSIKLIIAKNRIKIGLSYQILDLFPETFAGCTALSAAESTSFLCFLTPHRRRRTHAIGDQVISKLVFNIDLAFDSTHFCTYA